jgi:ribose transport system permease protein
VATNSKIKNGSGLKGFLSHILNFDEFGVFSGLLVIALVLTITSPDKFANATNLLIVFRQATSMGIMALGMVFVISMGDIDLSVGSIYNVVLIMTTWLMTENGLSMSIWPAVVMGMLVGATCGLINGSLIIGLKIPAIVVTLGTMSIFRGIGLVICQSRPIYQFSKDNAFFEVLGGNFGRIPASIVIWFIIAFFLNILFSRTPFGRRICAIGGNLQAAKFAGIKVDRTRLLVMTLNGFVTSLAALTALAFHQASDPSLGTGYEMFAIASAIIGGTALSGGKGSIFGAMLGSLIIAVIRNGVVILGLNIYWNNTVTGAVIIIAVAVDYFVKRRSKAMS